MRKMKMLFLYTMFLALFGVSAAQAGSPKVDVCHVPPGNPDNFHTIRISSNALETHLAHGDLAGSCNALCTEICDDGDACTVDDTGDCEEQGCPVLRDPTNCDDGLSCTIDSCNSAAGCVYEPVTCSASDLCHVSACDEMTGGCTETPVVCDVGHECNPETGSCDPNEPFCPHTGDPASSLTVSWEECFAGVTVTSCELLDPIPFFVEDFSVLIHTTGGDGLFRSALLPGGTHFVGYRQCPGASVGANCIDGCPVETKAICEQDYFDWVMTQPNCNP